MSLLSSRVFHLFHFFVPGLPQRFSCPLISTAPTCAQPGSGCDAASGSTSSSCSLIMTAVKRPCSASLSLNTVGGSFFCRVKASDQPSGAGPPASDWTTPGGEVILVAFSSRPTSFPTDHGHATLVHGLPTRPPEGVPDIGAPSTGVLVTTPSYGVFLSDLTRYLPGWMSDHPWEAIICWHYLEVGGHCPCLFYQLKHASLHNALLRGFLP